MATAEQRERPAVLFLMGPTASGKTDLAIGLHEALGCEIVSVDSALVYRGMDIGTAKPSPAELARAPHRLIDIIDPSESYSAARFRSDALQEIEEILEQGRTPLLAGGTMLYFRALLRGLSQLPEGDRAVRVRLEAEAAACGWDGMHRRLAEVDPVSAMRIHANDPQRICRALEVYEITGRPMSEQLQGGRDAFPWRSIKLAIVPHDRKALHERIARRFHLMLEQGFEEEVRQLLARGDLSPAMPSLRCVGYRQMTDYLTGAYDHGEMVDRGVAATRQLAKRQLTWLRSEPDLHVLNEEGGDFLSCALKIVGDSRT